ncbi:MAG: 5'-nucleotidase C-terminal domain-containing protein [Clostridia bacterium]|nr:5'-nucleotidase C-terminal domain-containing protein [Clostridia bacterium]
MKKILISLILILSLVLSGCDFLTPHDTDEMGNESGSQNETSGSDSSQSGDTSGSGGSSSNIGSKECDGETHADNDNNGKCDGCSISVLTELNFFVLNDFHGKMTDSGTQPGAEELSSYLKQRAANEPNAIILSSGDMWQGGAESNLTKGLLVTEWMNELDFVSMTLGNHEYDWGEEYIEANCELAEFPFLAINVYDTETNERVEYCQGSVMIERGGIEIGIIGAIGDCYSSISSDKTEGVYFKVGSELTALVKAESEKLRGEGADLIVYSLHDGHTKSTSSSVITDGYLRGYYDPSLSSGDYVDIVFEAHTHRTYNFRDLYGVYHIQAGGDNEALSHAEVKVNFANGSTVVTDTSIVSSDVYDDFAEDPYMDLLFEKYEELISDANVVLGTTSSYRSSTYLRKLVAELYYEFALKQYGDEYDIALGGGYISIRSPYELEAGEVTYSDLMMLFPFDNPLVLCSIKGYHLRTKFFETSNSDYFIAYGEYGESIKDNIDDNATYYVLVDTYTSQYAPNRLTVIEAYRPDFFARDLLAEYIKSGGLE